jgi:hypothetical protein
VVNLFVPVPGGQAAVVTERTNKHVVRSVLLKHTSTPTADIGVFKPIVGACRQEIKHAAGFAAPGRMAAAAACLAVAVKLTVKVARASKGCGQ